MQRALAAGGCLLVATCFACCCYCWMDALGTLVRAGPQSKSPTPLARQARPGGVVPRSRCPLPAILTRFGVTLLQSPRVLTSPTWRASSTPACHTAWRSMCSRWGAALHPLIWLQSPSSGPLRFKCMPPCLHTVIRCHGQQRACMHAPMRSAACTKLILTPPPPSPSGRPRGPRRPRGPLRAAAGRLRLPAAARARAQRQRAALGGAHLPVAARVWRRRRRRGRGRGGGCGADADAGLAAAGRPLQVRVELGVELLHARWQQPATVRGSEAQSAASRVQPPHPPPRQPHAPLSLTFQSPGRRPSRR